MTGPDVLARVDAVLADHFGQRAKRASVSFVGVDQIEVLRFEAVPGEYAYVSLGMSRHPMTGADEAIVAADGPRAELLLQVRDARTHVQLWRRLAVLAAAPSVEGVVYRAGATADLGEPLVPGSRCTGVVVTTSTVPAVDVGPQTPHAGSDAGAAAVQVEILQLLPATSTELAWARVHGSPALRERWTAAATPLADLDRAAVPLG